MTTWKIGWKAANHGLGNIGDNFAGTKESPFSWNQYLFLKNVVLPGHRVEIEGSLKPDGTINIYRGPWEHTHQGLPGKKLILTSENPLIPACFDPWFPGMTLEQYFLNISEIKWLSQYFEYHHLYFRNRFENRISQMPGSFPTDIFCKGIMHSGNWGFKELGVHNNVYDNYASCVLGVHEKQSKYHLSGNIPINIGWDAPDRGHGAASYLRGSSEDIDIVEGNVIEGSNHVGLRLYRPNRKMIVRGNVSSNNQYEQLLLGFGNPVADIQMEDNITFRFKGQRSATMSFDSLEGPVALKNNYFLSDSSTLNLQRGRLTRWTLETSPEVYTEEGTIETLPDFEVKVIKLPKWHGYDVEKGAIILVVMNREGRNNAKIDLSEYLIKGKTYVMRDSQNMIKEDYSWLSDPEVFVFNGRDLEVNLDRSKVSLPFGNLLEGTHANKDYKHSGKIFNKFIIWPDDSIPIQDIDEPVEEEPVPVEPPPIEPDPIDPEPQEPPTKPTPTMKVTEVSIKKVSTGEKLKTITTPGSTLKLNLADYPNEAIYLEVENEPSIVGSNVFTLNDQVLIENLKPYTYYMKASAEGNAIWENTGVGVMQKNLVSVIPYSEPKGQGTAGESFSFFVEIENRNYAEEIESAFQQVYGVIQDKVINLTNELEAVKENLLKSIQK